MNCKNCNTPMERVFSFDTQGDAYRRFECPNCGSRTEGAELTYTDEGNVIISTDEKGKPVLAYQVANRAADNYGKTIRIKPRNKKPFKKKPFNSNGKKNNGKPFGKRNNKGKVKPNAN